MPEEEMACLPLGENIGTDTIKVYNYDYKLVNEFFFGHWSEKLGLCW